MKKFLWLLLLIPLGSLFLMGFVDADSYPVYSGTLYINDSQYTPVTSLSNKSCQYWLNDYDCAVDSLNCLVNVSGGTLSGSVLVNGTEYQCRISSGSNVFEIYQEYRTTYGSSNAWVDYNLMVDELPTDSGSTFQSWLVVLICSFVSVLAVFGLVKFLVG